MLLGKLKILGHSMEPTIKNNTTVFVSNLFYLFNEPNINDIVAFKFNNLIFIKRISNIKQDQYFVSGDNPDDSLDSRKIGSIKRKAIIGKVFGIV